MTARTTPRPYQIAGVDWITATLANRRACYLIDDTGLGKTIQAFLAASRILKPGENMLVVCPTFLADKWLDEARKHVPDKQFNLHVHTYSGLINPDTLRFVTRYRYGLTVLDEGHYLKDFDSKRTQAILGAPGMRHRSIADVSDRMLFLSATPIPNRVGEIYPFLRTAGHSLIKGQTQEEFIIQWAEKYRFTKMGLTHRGIKEPAKFRAALSDVMFGRRKYDVLDDLPPFTRDSIIIPISKKLRRDHKEFDRMEAFGRRLLDLDIQDAAKLRAVPGFTEFQEFRKFIGAQKVKYVLDYLSNSDVSSRKKLILFCLHRDIAQAYHEAIPGSVLVHGGLDPSERYETVKKADAAESCVLIATMNSVKEGLDMTGFDFAIFTEFDWTFYLLRQVEGRLLRFGQKKAVTYLYFRLDAGLEDYMYRTLVDKEQTVDSVLPIAPGPVASAAHVSAVSSAAASFAGELANPFA